MAWWKYEHNRSIEQLRKLNAEWSGPAGVVLLLALWLIDRIEIHKEAITKIKIVLQKLDKNGANADLINSIPTRIDTSESFFVGAIILCILFSAINRICKLFDSKVKNKT